MRYRQAQCVLLYSFIIWDPGVFKSKATACIKLQFMLRYLIGYKIMSLLCFCTSVQRNTKLCYLKAGLPALVTGEVSGGQENLVYNGNKQLKGNIRASRY